MYTLINGSQKNRDSNSLHFLKQIKKELDTSQLFNLKTDLFLKIKKSILSSDVLVLAFPLYVDSPNYITIKFLDYIHDKSISLENKKVYVIINCGFREGHHNITALNIIKCWCKKVNADYYGALLIGAGEVVGKTKYKFISKKAMKSLKQFCVCIKAKEKNPDIITTMDLFNNKLFSLIANLSWNRQALKNGLSKEDISNS